MLTQSSRESIEVRRLGLHLEISLSASSTSEVGVGREKEEKNDDDDDEWVLLSIDESTTTAAVYFLVMLHCPRLSSVSLWDLSEKYQRSKKEICRCLSDHFVG